MNATEIFYNKLLEKLRYRDDADNFRKKEQDSNVRVRLVTFDQIIEPEEEDGEKRLLPLELSPTESEPLNWSRPKT